MADDTKMTDTKVVELVTLTGVSEAQAAVLLEAAGGDVNVAAGYILDGDFANRSTTQQANPTPNPPPVAQNPYQAEVPKPVAKKPERTGGITGFRDLAKDTDETPKGKDMSWFTGGASSGIAVQTPQQQAPNDIIKHVFDQAKQHGAISKADEKPEEKEKFAGSGFVLGNTAQSSQHVPAPKPQGGKVRVILTFYKDCFTVDDGPPRKLQDPANKPFLDDVNNGIVPRELEALVGQGDLNVELIDKKTEEYKPPPKPAVVAFSGAGQSLGGQVSGTKAAAKKIVVDESQPVTTLQIRLHDGQRLTLKVNQTHTVGDIRSHIEAAHPTGKGFELRTTFPPKVLSDDSQSVKDAGLLNAAIVQRLES